MSFKVKIKKDELLEKLKENRDKHMAIFEEAYAGYKKKVVEILEERLKAGKDGKKISHVIRLVEPINQISDYDRAILMLEMSVDTEIELKEDEFAQYVQDQWHWRHQFLTSNSTYSATAATVMAGE